MQCHFSAADLQNVQKLSKTALNHERLQRRRRQRRLLSRRERHFYFPLGARGLGSRNSGSSRKTPCEYSWLSRSLVACAWRSQAVHTRLSSSKLRVCSSRSSSLRKASFMAWGNYHHTPATAVGKHPRAAATTRACASRNGKLPISFCTAGQAAAQSRAACS